MSESVLLFSHLFSTLLMVGIIWFVQLVHYPLMACVGADHFRRYSQLHQSRATVVVTGPMLVEAVSAICLFIWFPAFRSSWAFLAATGLLGLIWVSTTWWQVPLHRSPASGYDDRKIRRLVQTNWLRTLAWSARGILIDGTFWSAVTGSV
jgi:hypothetical protein